jgi:hypothetical protein
MHAKIKQTDGATDEHLFYHDKHETSLVDRHVNSSTYMADKKNDAKTRKTGARPTL